MYFWLVNCYCCAKLCLCLAIFFANRLCEIKTHVWQILAYKFNWNKTLITCWTRFNTWRRRAAAPSRTRLTNPVPNHGVIPRRAITRHQGRIAATLPCGARVTRRVEGVTDLVVCAACAVVGALGWEVALGAGNLGAGGVWTRVTSITDCADTFTFSTKDKYMEHSRLKGLHWEVRHYEIFSSTKIKNLTCDTQEHSSYTLHLRVDFWYQPDKVPMSFGQGIYDPPRTPYRTSAPPRWNTAQSRTGRARCRCWGRNGRADIGYTLSYHWGRTDRPRIVPVSWCRRWSKRDRTDTRSRTRPHQHCKCPLSMAVGRKQTRIADLKTKYYKKHTGFLPKQD